MKPSRRLNSPFERRLARRPRLERLEDRVVMSVFTVTNLLDDGGAGTLRSAIGQANATTGEDEIVFDAGVTGTITLNGSPLVIDGGLTINGPGADRLTVSGNHASRVFLAGQITTLSGLTIKDGVADGDGGGVYNWGALTVRDCTFSGNSASVNGGGISSFPVYSYSGLTVTGSTFIGNSAGQDGGGIAGLGIRSNFTLSNSTLVGNSAGHDGGGIFGAGVVTNVTITANRSNTSGSDGTGGGIGFGGTANNTIVAGNFNGPSPGTTPDDISGTMDTTSAFNLIGTGGAGGLIDRAADPVHNNQVGVADPHLGPLGDHGGPTQTVPLLAGSPAVASGSKALAVNEADPHRTALIADQRGAGFPRTYIGTIDIGAFESQLAAPRATLTVTTASDSGPGSLRQSVQENNRLGGGNTIAFALPAGTTIRLTGGELLAIQDVTISGPGPDQLAVSGSGTSRVFGLYAGGTSTLSGLTIEDGKAGSSLELLQGGGIYMELGSLTIRNMRFEANSAAYGGAIAQGGGTLEVSNCLFSGNGTTATYEGGGIHNDGGTLTVSASTFTGNSAQFGGGISNEGVMTVSASTFAGNSAQFGGGGIDDGNSGQDFTVSDSAFTGNSTGGNGGGISYNTYYDSQLRISNSTFVDNTASGWGGGIYLGRRGDSTLTELSNVTIAHNGADRGGGLFVGNVHVYMSNSIVARNTAVTGPDFGGAFVASRGYNLVGDNSDGRLRALPGTPADQLGTASNPIDPLLAPLGYYGGPTQTMPLLPGSPAVNAGGNDVATAFIGGPLLTTDQRGFPRVVNGTVDIGAAEYQGITDPASDGVSDAVENAAPNGGDGNRDGILDSLQANVTSLPDAVDGRYVTLQSPAGTTLIAVGAVTNPPPGLPAGAQTPVGQLDFQVWGVGIGGTTTVTLFMPPGVSVNQYWKFVPSGWFDFKWNGSTGAKFRDVNGDGTKDIVLTFIDGGRGDDDRIANGVIVDPGAPVYMGPATVLPDGLLLIVGTDGDDRILVSPGGGASAIKVRFNGQEQTFVGVNRIVIYGNDGDDDIQISGGVTVNAWVDGGAGDDRLKGGSGNNVLLGGDGDDLLVGGSSRDLLIGGLGADRIVGDAGDDLLVAGFTAFDANDSALSAIMAEWTSARSYLDRVKNLKGTGTGARANGTTFLITDGAASTVLDDGAVDVLTGSAGQDWFLFNVDGDGDAKKKDKVTDLSASEFATDIDFITGP